MSAATTADYKLFKPFTLTKGLELKNRVVLSPLTRGRADENRAPSAISEIYYEQRAGAGLLITEGTAISEQGYGWIRTPGLYTEKQGEGWKRVVDRVHAKGSKIFLQLCHVGRQGHSSFNAKRELVAPSALRIEEGHTHSADDVRVPYETPRAFETSEIAGVVDEFRRSAELAKAAGFDGVEIHCANGFLLDQFLQSVSNQRTDAYGGSVENRVRIVLEVVEAVKTVYPADRIAVRISPNGMYAGMGSADNVETFTYLLTKLRPLGLAYVALLDVGGFFVHHGKCRVITVLDVKTLFQGTVLANCGYTRDLGEGALRSGAADLVSFGRDYISNPDLAERFEHNWPLNPPAKVENYYSAGPQGYIDFPFYQPTKEAVSVP